MKLFKNSSSKTKKYLLPLLVVVAIVGIISSMSFAWVVSNTPSFENKFALKETGMELHEQVDNESDSTSDPEDEIESKQNVCVKNTGEADMYVRIKLAIYAEDDDDNVVATPDLDLTLNNCFDVLGLDTTTNWFEVKGVYYYNKLLAGGERTSDLFSEATQKAGLDLPDGTHLVMDVLAEAIQENGISVWKDVKPTNDKTLVGGKN